MNIYIYIILSLLINFGFSEKNSLEIQKEIDSTNKNLENIKKEISAVENEIDKIINEEKDYSAIVKVLNKKINLIELEIELLLDQEKNIKNKIENIKKNIELEEQELINRKNQLKKRAQYLYKNGRNKLLSKITSSDDWNKRISNIKYYKIILEQERKIKDQIKNSIENLISDNKKLKIEKENKEFAIKNKNEDYKKLKKEKNLKKDYIKKIADNKKKLENILGSKKNMMSKIENSIKQLISDKKTAKKIEDDLAKKRAKQNKSTSGNFAKMKGRLEWPSKGKIVGKFGLQTNPEHNTKIENLGIDIKTNQNEKIQPVLDGVVSAISYNREFGNYLLVSHGDGYVTVYAHIENIQVNESDYIQQDTIIGNVSNNNLLHFQIWKDESKLNPENWLK